MQREGKERRRIINYLWIARLWLTRTIDRSPRRAVNRPFRFTFCELKFRVPNLVARRMKDKKNMSRLVGSGWWKKAVWQVHPARGHVLQESSFTWRNRCVPIILRVLHAYISIASLLIIRILSNVFVDKLKYIYIYTYTDSNIRKRVTLVDYVSHIFHVFPSRWSS